MFLHHFRYVRKVCYTYWRTWYFCPSPLQSSEDDKVPPGEGLGHGMLD